MATDSFKIKRSLNINPETSPSLTENGDIAINSSTGKVQTRIGGTTDNVVQETTTQTLTNKTLTGPVISTISNSGTLTLPTGANTLATLAGAETFTNKTITAPAITTPRIDVVTLDGQASSPSNPSAGDYKLFVSDTTSKLTLRNSAGTETTVGSGSGGINYLSATGDAEAGITGWTSTAYTNGGLGGFPVAGYGFVSYSPNSTWNTSASSPLRGTSSFLYTKAAASAQGDLNYYTCAIDPADRGRQLSYNFDYTVVSGAYTDNDFCVAIYDVSNSKWIQPSGYKVSAVGTGTSATATGTFQTATNTASLNFCMFVLSSSTSAYSLKFDNLSLGPTVVPQSAAMSDWISYTPTGSWVSNTTYTGKWRRVGDSMELRVRAATSGAPTAVDFTASIPSGYTVDTAKLSGTAASQSFGTAVVISAGNFYHATVTYGSTTTVKVVLYPASAAVIHASSYVTNVVPGTFTSGDSVEVTFKVPITGWSSNTIVSDSAATREVTAKRSGTVGGTVGNLFSTSTSISLATSDFDSHGAYSTTTFVPPVPGRYKFDGMFVIGATFIAGQAVVGAIAVNGIERSATPIYAGGASGFLGVPISDELNLLAGESVTFRAYTGGTSPTLVGVYNRMAITMVQGPAQIQAATVVAAKYTWGATQSLTSGGAFTTFNPNTKAYDTTGMNSSGTLTIPSAGKYRMSFTVYLGAGETFASVNNTINCYYKVDNTTRYFMAVFQPFATATAMYQTITGTSTHDFIAGQTVFFEAQNTDSAAKTVSSGSSFSIERMSGVN